MTSLMTLWEAVEWEETIMILTRHSAMVSTIDLDQRVAASTLPSSTQVATPAERKRSTSGMAFS